MKFLGVNQGRQVTVGGTNSSNIHGTVMAGEMGWQWIGAAPEGFANSFYAYCVDLGNYVTSTQNVQPRSSEGFTNGVINGASKAAWLFTEYAATVHASGSAVSSAALQVAIWEAMYDTKNDLTKGAFNANGTSSQILNVASQYLTALYSANWNTVAVILNAGSSTGGGQDQITTRVSEPSTLLLLGAAFFGIATTLSRRRTA
jgi:hypothetical protein